jgi:uncharacterized protein YraI
LVAALELFSGKWRFWAKNSQKSYEELPMKRQTRAFLLNAATGIAIAATAALVLMPTVASAAAGYATTFVNVRADSNTRARVVNTLEAGEAVELVECVQGWCYVEASGNDGWVAIQYVKTGKPQPGVEIGIGPNGLSFGVTVPGTPVPEPEPEPEFIEGEACFYERTQYRGNSFCVEAGDEIPDLGGWKGRISSIENPDGLDVTVCTRTRTRGDCRTYTTDARSLGRFDDLIVSLTVD